MTGAKPQVTLWQQIMDKINIKKYLREILLILNPWILLVINKKWITNKNDIDVWFYNGYFSMPLHIFKENSPTIASQYFDTRIPFTLLGHLVYAVTPDEISKLFLNLALMHTVIILSVYTLMRKVGNRNSAFTGAMLLNSNVYYLRMIGSDYVDLGVVFFSAIILMLIYQCVDTNFKSSYSFTIGSLLICLGLTHPLSIFMLPLFCLFGIALIHDKKIKNLKTNIFHVLKWVSFGSVSSLVIFQLIYNVLTAKKQFIFLPSYHQLLIPSDDFQKEINVILNQSPWNRMYFLTTLVATISIFLNRKIENNNVRKFWTYSPLIFLGFYFVISPSSLNVFLSRDGLYISFLFVFIFMSLYVSIISRLKLKNISLVVIYLFIVFLEFVKFTKLPFFHLVQSDLFDNFRFILLFAVSIFLIKIINDRKLSSLNIVILSMLILFQTTINWNFDGNESVVNARKYVNQGGNGEVPYFLFSRNNMAEFANFASIPASLSVKGWWKTNLDYPDCHRFIGGETVKPNASLVIISRENVKNSENFSLFENCIGDLNIESQKQFKDSLGSYYIAKVRAPDEIENSKFEFLGSTLPTIIGFSDISTQLMQSSENAGFLTYGPYLNLSKGKYRVIIDYSSDTVNKFDVVGVQEGKAMVFKEGELPFGQSVSSPKKLEFDQILDKDVVNFEIRTIFSGRGKLSIQKISIIRLP